MVLAKKTNPILLIPHRLLGTCPYILPFSAVPYARQQLETNVGMDREDQGESCGVKLINQRRMCMEGR